MKTRPFVAAKSYEKNIQRAKTGQVCVYCGKDVKDPPGYLHLIEGGSRVLHPDDEEKFLTELTDNEKLLEGDLGLHPIGSSCAFKYQDWLFIFEE